MKHPRRSQPSSLQEDLPTYGGHHQVPLEVYHGVPPGWRKSDVLAVHAALRGSFPIDGPEASEPGAPNWLPDRYNWLQYRETLYRVADGVRAKDHACVELAVRYILSRYIGSYSGFLRARLARALKQAPLDEEQVARLNNHFLELVEQDEFGAEFRDYLKLWRVIIKPEIRKEIVRLSGQAEAKPKWRSLLERLGR